MRQFVLIDQSIRGLTGHHYEYAVHVLGAAEKAGYQPILAANRKFTGQDEKGWPIFREYQFGFWSEPGKRQFDRRPKEFIRRMRFLVRCKLCYSALGLFWLGRTDRAKYLARKPRGLSGFLTRTLGLLLIAVAKVLRLPGLLLLLPFWVIALSLVGLWEFLRLVARPPAFQRYVQAVLLELRKYAGFLRAVARSAGLQGKAHGQSERDSESMAAAFGRDTRNLFSKVILQSGDVVFVPTISHRDLLGLLDFFQAGKIPAGASWHFLFRRNLYRGTLEESSNCVAEVTEIQSALQNFQEKIGGHEVFFYTDSTELTRQYDQLETFSFHTLPIPHTYSGGDATPAAGPLRVTYLGDARREKGYHLLPTIVGDLRQEVLAGKLQFVFQSNYNIPGGEPEAVVARAQLESFPESMVQLRKEALSSEDYKSLLLSSDITILPYDRNNYGARSSGVLVESLAAGIPVIVPAGTWLSRQLLTIGYADEPARLRMEMRVIQSLNPSSLFWCWHGAPGVSALVDGKLEPGYESKTYCWLDVPELATDLLFTARFSAPPYEGFLWITQVDHNRTPIGPVRRSYLQCDEKDGKLSVVCHLSAQARILWIAVGSTHENARVQIEDVQINLLRQPQGESIPSGAAGLVYQEVGDIPALIREVAGHYPHYRRTAAEFARKWRSFHNADRLVADLTQNASSGSRISAEATDTFPAGSESVAERDIACA